eukprot:491607-Pleurochrysis_carterae.AAC.1
MKPICATPVAVHVEGHRQYAHLKRLPAQDESQSAAVTPIAHKRDMSNMFSGSKSRTHTDTGVETKPCSRARQISKSSVKKERLFRQLQKRPFHGAPTAHTCGVYEQMPAMRLLNPSV